ncbi:threonine--tRNA ligase 2, cytoplasmic isoform X3 [Nycticebus coucang]|uniref:threonine--tRNA ligase 2, cytoplasmic isoform X3 n=1 Tax=Nycticebus coucang TaxID=9470 RepID=UPI00234C7356|nr:threonine--tRNA ligase 2, cytoplasmic isoform X3 [Nycticebus coucang]
MAAKALAAEAVASRLQRQEEDIRWLWAEVQRLRDEQLNAPDRCPAPAEGQCLPREVAQLRAENRELRHRLYRLRLCLTEELSHRAKREGAAGAQDEAGRAAGGAQFLPEAGFQPGICSQRPTQQLSSIQSQEKEAKKKKMKESEPDSEVKCQPNFIKERLKLFEILKKDRQPLLGVYEKKENTSKVITVRLDGGKTVEGEVWKTTPYQVAAEISQDLAESTVIARVNGELWDLDRPLEGDSTLELLTFDNKEAQAVYWHSSAHILGEAMELYYGGHLCYGPPIENGFYYDMFMEDRAVSSTELSALENICKDIIKEKQAFERLEVSKEILLEMFKYNKFKCRILNEKVNTASTTVYRCGPLIDLCKGPHVRHTGKIKTIKIFKNSSTYWEGDPEMETLQRVYGISFPDNRMMKVWEKLQEEAMNRDHRKIGKEQELFFFHDLSPGSCFFLPRGAFIYNTLMDFIRIEEEIKGCLQFLQYVYSTFGCFFQLNLSTRPENFLGEIEMWDKAEKQLKNSLMEFGEPWKMNPGDGSFYGPKIDIKIKDAIGRYHQCATIQLDFQLPIRFNLTYVSKDGDDKKRPVIIHRAILGSVERMIAILSENYGGKWPFWLSPRQVMVIPVGPTCEEYALQVSTEFFEEGFMADVDLDHSCTLNKKIRNAQLAQYNFVLVVGEKEKINNAVNVRTRDNKIHGEISVISAIDKLKNLKKSRTLNAEEDF